MFLEPKKDFRASNLANGWNDVVDSLQFQNAAKTALLQMQLELSGAVEDKAKNDARHQQMLRGARRFLEIFMSLTEASTPPKTTTPRALNYTTFSAGTFSSSTPMYSAMILVLSSSG
jgi:hypothetical protein